jgi:hypothetical protein
MRSFFLLLVLVNVAYFGWKQFGANGDVAAEPPVQEDVSSLTLLAELPERPESLLSTGDISIASQSPAMPASISGVAAAALPDSEPAEPAGAVVTPVPAALPLITSPQEPEERSRVCSVVAGFTASDPALVLVRTLNDAEVTSYTLSGDESATVVYWVYLPKPSSEALARSTLAELQAKGIDSFYLDSGELAGGISLGVFTRREGALRTQEELVRRGYSASIQEVARAATRFRVVVESTREALMAEPGMQKFLENNPGLDVSDFVCEGVAEQN